MVVNWKRSYMPRTSFVFINDEADLTDEQKSEAANIEAEQALASILECILKVQSTLTKYRRPQIML